MAEDRTLDLLLEDVQEEGRKLTSWLHENSFYQPCFRPGGLGEFPTDMPPEIQESRRKLMDTAKAVQDLAAGPAGYMRNYSKSYHDTTVLHFLTHYKIPQAVPLIGSTTYPQIAEACSVDEATLRRILHYAMIDNLFYSPSFDEVAHTPFSAVLVTDPGVKCVVEYAVEESFPVSAKFVEAYEPWGASEEPNNSAWCLNEKSDIPFFERLSQPGFEPRAERFERLVSYMNDVPGYDLKYTVEGFDWQNAAEGGTIVDIGGSTGQTAIALARAYPEIKHVIVEDLDHAVQTGRASLPADLKDRITFTSHNFLEQQPHNILSSSSIFILRCVLHNFSDKDARRTIRNLLPGLKRKDNPATLLVIDSIMPLPGTLPLSTEKELRRMDMEMMQMHSASEREMQDWEALFGSVDRDLMVRNVNLPVGSALGIMEVVYDG